jgi:CelD/BcsL family acetyltransferase involved in cellulose biosynthesis
MQSLVAAAHSWRDWPAVRSDWTALVDSSPYASFCHSPEWIEPWIEVYGPHLQPQILLFRAGARAVAAALLVVRRQRRGPIPLRRVYLNACGEDEAEETALEFNDLLCLSGFESATARALRQYLDALGWDEFLVPGCSLTAASAALKEAFSDIALESRTTPSYFINLEELRRAGTRLEQTLSAKGRYNIRQSMKLLEATAPVSLEQAQNTEQAVAQLRELAALHQESWRVRGELGAFHSPRYVRFHEQVVQRTFPGGFVETTALRCGKELVGALYCVGWRGTLYFYQCGFKYSDNKRLRPGLCTLLLSIQGFLADAKWREFDLMAGDSEYKRTFSDQHRDLEWMTFRQPTIPVRLIAVLRRVRHAWRARTLPDLDALRRALPFRTNSVLLFRHDLKTVLDVEGPPGLEIVRIERGDLGRVDRVSLLGRAKLDARLARGDWGYLALLNGEPVHYAWVQLAGSHYITDVGRRTPVGDDECWIYHCYTSEAARGQRVYPRVLVRILRDAAAQGLRTAWIYALEANKASLHGFERAGFQPSTSLRALRLAFWLVPLSSSKADVR